MSDYVDERDRNNYVAGTRIGLDSIVYSVWEGQSPERILQSFPGVGSVETMRGVIAFYQANKEKIDAWMEEGERIWEEAVAKQAASHDPVLERLRSIRKAAMDRRAS